MDKCRWLVWWLVQPCSTLITVQNWMISFFPSYMSRFQDFLRVKTSESLTWFISTRKGSLLSMLVPWLWVLQSLFGPFCFIILVEKQPEEFRTLSGGSDNCRRLAGKEKGPSCFRWSWGSGCSGYAQPFWRALHVARGWLTKNPQCQASFLLPHMS